MTPEIQILLTFGVFLLLLCAGMAVPFAIAVPGVLYLLLQGGLPALRGLGMISWGSMNSFTLTAIPMFILMAEVLQHSGLSFRIYRGLSKLVCVLPGGLLQTNIVGCALFAAISGSSVATAASIGGVALPQLIERKYDRRISAGSLAAGGTLGILFPPSLAMIVYGSFTDSSGQFAHRLGWHHAQRAVTAGRLARIRRTVARHQVRHALAHCLDHA